MDLLLLLMLMRCICGMGEHRCDKGVVLARAAAVEEPSSQTGNTRHAICRYFLTYVDDLRRPLLRNRGDLLSSLKVLLSDLRRQHLGWWFLYGRHRALALHIGEHGGEEIVQGGLTSAIDLIHCLHSAVGAHASGCVVGPPSPRVLRQVLIRVVEALGAIGVA